MSEAFEKLYLEHEKLKKSNESLGNELRRVSDALYHMYLENCKLKRQLNKPEPKGDL